jgi:hypothetical protein
MHIMLNMIVSRSNQGISPFPIPLSAHTAPVPEPIEDPLPGEHPIPQEDPVPSPNPEIDDPKSPRKTAASTRHHAHY